VRLDVALNQLAGEVSFIQRYKKVYLNLPHGNKITIIVTKKQQGYRF
jgi:hypothetical protein